MLHLVRDKSPYTVIILLIFTLLVKLQALTHPALPTAADGHIFYSAVISCFSSVLGDSAFAYTMLSVIMLFGQAIYLNAVVVKHKLYNKTAYIPSFIFIVLSSLHPSLSHFSLPLLLNWALIGALDILLGMHHTQQPRKDIFNAGFILCIMGLLHFPAVLYLLVLFLTLLLLRSFNPAEWVVGILGYLTPIYFFGGILFLFDKLGSFRYWPEMAIYFPKGLQVSIYAITLLAGVSILLIAGLFAMQAYMARLGVFMRRSWVVVFAMFVISLAICIFTDENILNIWLLAIPASSLVISHPLYLEKSKWFSNFAFYFSLLVLIVCQWAL